MCMSSRRSSNGLEQRAVVERYRNGKSDKTEAVAAAAALFDEYGTFIRAVIRFQARNEFQEDDLFQQFFLSLVKRPVPASIDNIKSYLYRAIVNDIIDTARRKARRRKHFEKLSQDFRNSIHKRVPSHAILGEARDDAAFVCLTRQLPRREAQAVTLRYQENRSVSEIAQMMGVDQRTVSHHLAGALRHLRRICAIE